MAKLPDGRVFIYKSEKLRIVITDRELVLCGHCKWRGTNACFCKAPEDVKDDWFCSEGVKEIITHGGLEQDGRL